MIRIFNISLRWIIYNSGARSTDHKIYILSLITIINIAGHPHTTHYNYSLILELISNQIKLMVKVKKKSYI
jgi:hypothetical protein